MIQCNKIPTLPEITSVSSATKETFCRSPSQNIYVVCTWNISTQFCAPPAHSKVMCMCMYISILCLSFNKVSQLQVKDHF